MSHSVTPSFGSWRSRVLVWLRSLAHPRERLLAAALAITAGLTVFVIATTVFEFHSSNHDEGVYLQQAELLLDGQLRLDPGAYGDAVRPWFFVDDGDQFFPKYQPLPAGLYALAIALFDEPRVALAAVAAGNAALVYVLGSQVFDRRVGLLAAAGFGFAPMTLATSSVFLAYAPTTFCNLAFATAYLRGVRENRVRFGAIAGVAIGVAFFMRPYTAVLFALPFVAHALWQVLQVARDRPPSIRSLGLSEPLRRQGATAAVGLIFVAAALAYNAVVTGSPVVFPYEAFAPLDGPGFGRRRLLSHGIEYTPSVAVGANGHVVWYLLTRWVPAGALGSALAALGLVASTRHVNRIEADQPGRLLLASLFVSVPVGNLFFWGNYNVLATWSDPTDGFLGQFGPFYHFDLLVPVAIFGAAGLLALWRTRTVFLELIARSRPSLTGGVRVGTLALVALVVIGMVGVNAALVANSLERNNAYTATYEQAYAPFEEHDLDDALVFVPTPYGEWLNHPFQYLRNDGDLDGPIRYVMDLGPESDFAAVDAASERSLYRYTFQGEWTGDPDEREVIPKLEPLELRAGERLNGEMTVGVPDRVSHANVRLVAGEESASYTIDEFDDAITVEYTLERGQIAFAEDIAASRDHSVRIDAIDSVALQVRLVQSEGQTLTYRQEASVRSSEEGVEVIWPPERTVCPLVDDCGREGTYLPDQSDHPFEGVFFETSLEPTDS